MSNLPNNELNKTRNITKYEERTRSIGLRCYVLMRILVIDYNCKIIIHRKKFSSSHFCFFHLEKIFDDQNELRFDSTLFEDQSKQKRKYHNQRNCLEFLIHELERKGFVFSKLQTRKVTENSSYQKDCSMTKIKTIEFPGKYRFQMNELEETIGIDIHKTFYDVYNIHFRVVKIIYCQKGYSDEMEKIVHSHLPNDKELNWWVGETSEIPLLEMYIPCLHSIQYL